MTVGSKKLDTSAMNAHKAMAGAGSTGNFGVKPYPGRAASHPDVGMSHEPMADGARSASVKGMQGAPDHGIGKGVSDHFMRAGKL